MLFQTILFNFSKKEYNLLIKVTLLYIYIYIMLSFINLQTKLRILKFVLNIIEQPNNSVQNQSSRGLLVNLLILSNL